MATTGGCLCGAVRYSCEGDPVLSGICHCRHCQKYTGSSFEPIMFYPCDQVTVTGKVATYTGRGDSGKPVFRNFCPVCGSGVFAQAELLAGLTIVLAGTLDDPTHFKPTMECYCDRVQPWIRTADERARHPRMPPV